jgi:hypothetical protein
MASSILRSHDREPLPKLVERCHDALRATRGVVMSLARFDASRGTMAWLGIGNVQGVLLGRGQGRDAAEKSLLLRSGVAGVSPLPLLHLETVRVAPGDILVFATDGIRTDFSRELARTLPPQRAAESILAAHGKITDDALVLVAHYLGKRETTRERRGTPSRRARRGPRSGSRGGADPTGARQPTSVPRSTVIGRLPRSG